MTFLAMLAVWRITSLLTNEDGPGDIFEHMRERFNPYGVFDCFWCTSVWVAIPFALYLSTSIVDFVVYLGALSAGGIIVQEFVS